MAVSRLEEPSLLADKVFTTIHAAIMSGELPAGARLRVLRAVGLALAASEKTVQVVYEHRLRPEDKRHGPWLDRVRGQLQAACRQLEHECATAGWTPDPADEARLDLAGLSAAVAWTFMLHAQPQVVDPADFPHLAAWTARAETLPAFRAYPYP